MKLEITIERDESAYLVKCAELDVFACENTVIEALDAFTENLLWYLEELDGAKPGELGLAPLRHKKLLDEFRSK